MFKKILTDLHAEIDLPRPRWTSDLDGIAADLEYEAKDLTEFIRDHRSRDSYHVDIVREYRSTCGFCGREEERDNDGTPVCCQKAVDEFMEEVLREREVKLKGGSK